MLTCQALRALGHGHNNRGISTELEYKFTWYNTAPADFATAPMNTVSNLKPKKKQTINDVTYTVTIFKSDCTTPHQQSRGCFLNLEG